MNSITIGTLLNILDEYRSWTYGVELPLSVFNERQRRYNDFCTLLQDIIDASHQGCAADEVILTLGDEL